MSKRQTQRTRDTARAIPFTYNDPARGVRITATTLRYFVEPMPATVAAAWRVNRTTLAQLKQDVDTLLAVERHRARYAVPPQLVPREAVTSAPIPSAPYAPRKIAQDSEGYVPKSVYSRGELVALLLQAARNA